MLEAAYSYQGSKSKLYRPIEIVIVIVAREFMN